MRHLYTDGSSLGNPGPGGWGYVLLDEVKKVKVEGSGGIPDTTNNRMELQAVIEGLKQLLKRHEIVVSTATTDQGLGMFGEVSAGKTGGIFDGEVVIFTDSTYVKQGITEWIDTWIKRDWRLSKGGKLVKNVDLWQELYAVVQQFNNLDWQWVKAHVGNKWNERVDDLARGAAEKL